MFLTKSEMKPEAIAQMPLFDCQQLKVISKVIHYKLNDFEL